MAGPQVSGVPPPDEDRGQAATIVSWIFLALSVITVVLRLFTRGILRRTLGWDDYTIVIATVCTFANDPERAQSKKLLTTLRHLR